MGERARVRGNAISFSLPLLCHYEGGIIMAENGTASQTDQMRIKYGFWIVILGLVLVTVVFLVAMKKYAAASEVTGVVGSVTGVVGTIIGAFFGVQVGSAGKEKAETARTQAEDKVVRLAAALSPNEAKSILGIK
jgi:hypothetical protein